MKKRKSGSLLMDKCLRQKENIPKEIRLDQAQYTPECGLTFRRCNHCSTKKEPLRTEWLCTICKIPLCNNAARNCFSLYHT